MPGNRYIERNTNGDLHQRASVNSSAGAGDANKIVALNADGKIDLTMLYAETVQTYTASENIAAGALINIHDSTGVKVRNASNTSSATRAHGFAPSAITSGNPGTVVLVDGTIGGLVGLTVGAEYVLGTAGAVVEASSSPTADNTIVQRVGVARSTTELEFHAGGTIIINDSAT